MVVRRWSQESIEGYALEHTFNVVGVRAKKDEATNPVILIWNPDVNQVVDIDPANAWNDLKRYNAMTMNDSLAHDGTVPAWSARLPTLADDHVKLVYRASHRELAKNKDVMSAVLTLAIADRWDNHPVIEATVADWDKQGQAVAGAFAGKRGAAILSLEELFTR